MIATITEQWRPIAGWIGYEISNEGRARSTRGPLRIHLNAGYPSFNVHAPGGRRAKLTVHRQVAIAFIGQPPTPDHVVRHLNGNPTDAHVTNLAWGTETENAADKEAHGRTPRGEQHPGAILSNRAVAIIRRSPRPVAQLAERYNVSKSNIYAIRAGTRRQKECPF